MDRLITARLRSNGYAEAVKKRKKRGEALTAALAQTKRFSTGVLAKEGVYCLNNPCVLDGMQRRQKQLEEAQKKSDAKKKSDMEKYRKGVKAIRAKYGPDGTR